MIQQLAEWAQRTAQIAVTARHRVAVWGPTWNAPALLSPFATLVAVVGLALLSGVAVAAVAVLIAALVGLYVLLTEVFGLSVELAL